MIAVLPLFLSAIAADTSPATRTAWEPTSVQDLHREYNNIFRHGNRNAASHLWSTFIFERSHGLSPSTLEMLFTGFCAVSGSPTRPSDYTRYRLTLPLVSGGITSGYMYYCCWPCVCDTQDFIRVDTKNVTLANGESRRYHFAVVGNACEDESKLDVPFVQPFYMRGETTLRREAPEVRCHDGTLLGATLSDHGYPIISMFFDAVESADGHISLGSDGGRAISRPPESITAQAVAVSGGAEFSPRPGRITRALDGTMFQDEAEYAPMCSQRAANGYNSGMGEIFRKVASISPVRIAENTTPELPESANTCAGEADEAAPSATSAASAQQ